MYNEEEKQYAALRVKFKAEIAQLEQEIEKAMERLERLRTLVYGDPAVDEESDDSLDLTTESVQEVTVGGDSRPKIDKALLRYLEKNPGAKRSEIVDGLKSYGVLDVKRAMDRVRRRGLIVSEGRARAAAWYLAEES